MFLDPKITNDEDVNQDLKEKIINLDKIIDEVKKEL